jgi:hypothetical protein
MAANQSNKLGIASLVIGIISFFFGLSLLILIVLQERVFFHIPEPGVYVVHSIPLLGVAGLVLSAIKKNFTAAFLNLGGIIFIALLFLVTAS